MSKSKKEFKLKYVLMPVAGLIGTAAAVFACKKIHEKNFNGGMSNVKAY